MCVSVNAHTFYQISFFYIFLSKNTENSLSVFTFMFSFTTHIKIHLPATMFSLFIGNQQEQQ